MIKNVKILAPALALVVTVFVPQYVNADTVSNSREYLNSLNAGVSNLIDASAYQTEQSKEALEHIMKLAAEASSEEDEAEEESTLFMANVSHSVNVRVEPSEDADKAGVLYKDCGGRILEKGDGWTRIQSGDLVGWVSNDFLLFNEEAEALAEDVGFKILSVNTDALRIRKEPSDMAEVLALVANGDELEVIDDEQDNWIEVDYEGETGFVAAEFVNITFSIDAGETIEAIRIREEEAAAAAAAAAAEARKAKLREQQAAIMADGNDLRLLAALIQCEAGTRDAEGQLAVGAVVMNRVRSGAYPNTISGVIYASGQFTPALNGKVAAVYNGKIYDSCFVAAQAALDGQTNVGTATHFRRSKGGHEGVYYGGQVFW